MWNSNSFTAKLPSLAVCYLRFYFSVLPTPRHLYFSDNIGGDDFVVVEFHGHGGAAFGHGAERGRVAEHLGERHLRMDDFHHFAVFDGADLAALRGKIAVDVAHELLGRRDLNAHDRLKDDRVGFLRRFAERVDTRELEGDFRGVHFVERTVKQLT